MDMQENAANAANILAQLNEAQREAVEYCDSPQLVIAGAGSGKTRVLTYKIAYLLEHYSLKPWNILALTFTNKAAREMKERIAQLVGEERARSLNMGTFHSIFSRILRIEARTIGFSSDFTIYDETDSRTLLKNIIKQMGLDDKTYKPAAVHASISMAKNQLCGPDQYAADGDVLLRDRRRNMPEIYKIFMAYQQRLRQANAMDFDDLLTETYRLLRNNEDVRKKYAQRFAYILVDEYQDTNYAQQQIVELLSKGNPHVCVVGDDYQSIYAFRGANIANILQFSKIYTSAKLFKLERNYRSTKNIVGAANSLMKHNHRQIDKNVYSENAEGPKIVVHETSSDRREASVVCSEIRRLISTEGLRYSDIAILYRTNAQSRTFEEEMRKPDVDMGSHYRIYGGLSFYQRKEIKDIIAYCRLVVNHDDEEAFRRIINYPARGIGNTTVQKIADAAVASQTSMWQVTANPVAYGLDVNRGAMTKLVNFCSLITSFAQDLQTKDALTLGKEIIQLSGVETDLAQDKTVEGQGRRENVDALLSGMASFVQSQQEEGQGDHTALSDYLQTVSLMTDTDNDDGSQDKVTLMSIHSAKGLEFNTVFIVGLEENIFPNIMSVDDNASLEEERRLLYVAITRAEKHCHLTWAHTRWRFGKMDSAIVPSRFLREIDARFIEVKKEGGNGGGFSHRPWDDDYEINKPYTGFHAWGDGYQTRSGRMQNSRPVAGQFMADPKPKITSPRKPEAAVSPFSDSFEKKLRQSGNWKRISKAITNGGRSMPEGDSASTEKIGTPPVGKSPVAPGNIIEHTRFGRGTVVKVEGAGENCKATVDFGQNGVRQLLLKFAPYKVIG